MNLLFDLLPIVAFFVALKVGDVYAATYAAVAATIVAAIYQKLKRGKIETMTIVSCVLMVVFGGLTIALHDETFVMWKPTVLNLLFAGVFLFSRFYGAQPMVQRLLGKMVEAERAVWNRVNDCFAIFFVGMAGLNLLVAYNFSIDTWATFKLVGFLGLNFLATGLAIAYLFKRGKPIDQSKPPADAAALPAPDKPGGEG